MAARVDLLAEIDEFSATSYTYISPWFDSASIYKIRVIFLSSSATVKVEESNDQTNVIAEANVATSGSEFAITARYFRLAASVGGNSIFRGTIRVVN